MIRCTDFAVRIVILGVYCERLNINAIFCGWQFAHGLENADCDLASMFSQYLCIFFRD